ncbi:MAG: hypothetical protein ACREQQ_15300, partial [Candidatus Binatia bacterium]
ALGTGWFLIRLYGAAATNGIAVALNLAVALAALGLAFRDRPAAEPASPVGGPAIPPSSFTGGRPVFAAAAFLAGFQAMALQVVWNRTLVCVVENNTTSFSLILASVLLGSAIGAFLYLVLPRFTDPLRGVKVFFAVELVLSVAVLGSIPLLNRLYDIARVISGAWPIQSVLDLCLVRWSVAMLPVVPASAAAAFLVPVLIDARAAAEPGDAPKAVSAILAADALGSVAGSLVGGFAMIPLLGLGSSLIAVAWLAIATGLGAALALASRRWSAAFLLASGAAAALAFAVGPLTLTRWYEGHKRVRGELLYYHEGLSGTISVFRVDDRKELLINCIEEVPNHRDAMLLFKLLGHTPLLLHQAPRDVLVNALGGGITLGAVLQHPVKVEAVELVPEVRDAMRLFAEENNNAANRTDWRLVADDGRNHLRLAAEPYDVITADATHPAAGESWPLYTIEYYEIVRARLKPNGVFAQWLPLHNLVEADFLGTMRTFRRAFPEMLVLFANRYCILIGSPTAISLDAAALTSRIRGHPRIAADLAPYGIESGPDLLKYLTMDGEAVDRLTAGAEIMTDDRPAVEFAELRRIGVADTFPTDLAALIRGLDPARLARRTGVPATVFEARRNLLEAQLARRQPTLEATFEALIELEAARSLTPNDQDVEVAIANMQAELLGMVARDYVRILERPDLERAAEILDYARQLHPDDPFLNQLLGAAFLRLRRWNDAAPYLEVAANARPDDVTYQSNLAFAYEQSGRDEEALEVVRRLEALAPGNPAFAKVRERIERRLAEKGKGS